MGSYPTLVFLKNSDHKVVILFQIVAYGLVADSENRFYFIRFANYWQGHRNSMTPTTAGP